VPVRARLLFAAFNLTVIALYRGLLDVPSRPLERLLGIALLASLVALALARSSRWPAALLHDLQLALASAIMVLLAAELLWRTAPWLMPQAVRDQLQERDIEEERRAVVEYLDRSPYVKFRPGTLVRSQGYRGSDAEFVYAWTTDRRGFKNPEAVSALERVEIVALGDSFTEGMGVAPEQAWPALLTRAGRPTYNLGVQGYAPTQLAGALRAYGLALSPRTVIVGWCSGSFLRQEAFLDEDAARRNRRFAGGIQTFVEREIRQQRRFVTSVLFQLAYEAVASAVTALKDLFRETRGPAPAAPLVVAEAFRPWAGRIGAVPGWSLEMKWIEGGAPVWRSALGALASIRDQARSIGADVLLVYLPGLGEMYFEKATGRPLPERYLEKIEAAALERFCRQNGLGFVNLSERVRSHVASLSAGSSPSDYPYLTRDAHLSARGHELVAGEILEYLRRHDRGAGMARR
jgi:hypothetical protein